MKCNIEDLKIYDGHNDRIRFKPVDIIGRIKLWLCNKKGTHDFELLMDEWYNGNVYFRDLTNSIYKPVELKEAERWCSRHTILKCKHCGFEWERMARGVKGCGAHTWIAGKKWEVEWHCLPWNPYETVRVGTSTIPESVMQINNPNLEYLRDEIKV